MISLAALPDEIVAAMRGHVAHKYPYEGCGVVLSGPAGLEHVKCFNAAWRPAHHFSISRRDLIQIGLRLKAGDQIAAIYHSHCDSPAVFSERDHHYAAAWPDALHLVFGVTARGVLAQHAYTAEGICLDEPVMEPA